MAFGESFDPQATDNERVVKLSPVISEASCDWFREYLTVCIKFEGLWEIRTSDVNKSTEEARMFDETVA